ncbi:glycosyltransferase [Phenylobacterium sp. LjRoot225]|uniref:glycosyltransferase n=1 Tax=Phenylobacterium sp. LjRoot225 TaxID=3342285 RepID=UPI003ED05244
MPKPVVLFCAALTRDGVARNTVHLANALAGRGAAVEVVCLEDGPLAADLAGPVLTRLGRRRGPRAFALAAAVPALRRRLEDTQAGLVLSMGNHAHLAVWAALRGMIEMPRLYRISNDLFHPGEVPLLRGLRALGLRLIARDATRLVSVSAVIAQRRPFRAAHRDRRLDVVANGVDAAVLRARGQAPCDHPWTAPGAPPFLVAVGRLHRQKNLDGLIEALARLRAVDAPDLRLLVLGRGPAHVLRRFEALAAARGVADSVRFEGEVADPLPLVARAAAYVLPSRWEGASNSLLEALACGAPVVAAVTAGSAPEVLAGGRYGVLARPEPADLARAIRLQLDPATRILPQDRADHYSLHAATDRLCRIVLQAHAEARTAHGEIQMSPEAARHLSPVGKSLGGRNTEY